MDKQLQHHGQDQLPGSIAAAPEIDSIKMAIQLETVNAALLVAGLREHELRADADDLAERLKKEIEHRRRSDDLVRASEIRFRRLFETTETGILIVDAASKTITGANPYLCSLLEYPADELLGRDLWQLQLFEDKGSLSAAISGLADGGHCHDEDMVLRTKFGRTIQVGFVANLYDEGGVEVIQCNIRDVTAFKMLLWSAQAASAAATSANNTKDILLASLSHELRTPLNPILLLASERASDVTLSDEVREDFASIEKNTILEAHLIDELLDFTKIVRGKLALNLRPISVNEVLNDAIANVRGDIDAKCITLELTLAGESIVMGDALRLQQVFWNVLKNAVKFSERFGRISVRSQTDPKRGLLEIEFRDSGTGISPGEIERIFEPFRQGSHGANGHKYGGLGLGLSIARNVLELHSGSIKAESMGIGFGSAFTVELPLQSPLATGIEPKG